MLIFITNSILLGVGLAMDAFCVSMVNALLEPGMSLRKRAGTAGVYAAFQFLMPVIGWIFVHLLMDLFSWFTGLVPYIAFILLLIIGINMIRESREKGEEGAAQVLTPGLLVLQGIATSIDALSVGFTIAGYTAGMAFLSAAIIGAVTFVICMAGLKIGKSAAGLIRKNALTLGGAILIFIGAQILLRHLLL